MVAPMPTAGPFTAEMTGFVQSKSRKVTRPAPSRGAATSAHPLATDGLALGVAVVVERPGAAREVGAGTERSTAPGQDHRPHVVVGVDGGDGGEELADHRRRPRVQLVRPVQGDGGDVVSDVVVDLGEVHARTLDRAGDGNRTRVLSWGS